VAAGDFKQNKIQVFSPPMSLDSDLGGWLGSSSGPKKSWARPFGNFQMGVDETGVIF